MNKSFDVNPRRGGPKMFGATSVSAQRSTCNVLSWTGTERGGLAAPFFVRIQRPRGAFSVLLKMNRAPAKAGAQGRQAQLMRLWVPAFAGTRGFASRETNLTPR
jgi:hypothetical protein